MDIQATIEILLANTDEIKNNYPSVDNVRHRVYNIPYADLKVFAQQHRLTIHTDKRENRVYVIHSPLINGIMDSDIWLYSGIVQIKPAEVIEL